MKQFYVRDQGQIKYFSAVPEVVLFLEQVVKFKFQKTRSQWMEHVIDLGYGLDDREGRVFTESIADQVEIGTVQKDGRHVRCNIFEATTYLNGDYGD